MNILIAILALSFLIIVHEFGHFIVAKLSGIKVLEFSLFMGPKIISVKRGETDYSLRLVPLGGFVKMEGEEESSEDARAFNRKPARIRAAVIAAGPIMNLVVAVILISIALTHNGFGTTKISNVTEGSPAYQAGIKPGDSLVAYAGKKIYMPSDLDILAYGIKPDSVNLDLMRNGQKFSTTIKPLKYRYILGFNSNPQTNQVIGIVPGNPAEKAGLKINDKIVRLNDANVSSISEVISFLNRNKTNPVTLTVLRDGKEITLNQVTPKQENDIDAYTAIGIGNFEYKKGTLPETVKASVAYSYSTARSVYYSLAWLISGRVSFNQLMGPVGIVNTVGTVVQHSQGIIEKIINLVSFTAFISINLGLMNLVPFPALDGSKLILLAVEAVRKKALPPEKEAYISLVGLALLVMLMIFATYNDILRIFRGG